MNKSKFISYIFSLLLSNIYISPIPNTLPVNKILKARTEEIRLNTIGEDYDRPEASGQVNKLPWRNDKDFLESKEKYNTPILMAGYCAVLKDPLPGEGHNVSLASQSISSLVLKPSKLYSMNASLGPYSKSKGYKDGASYRDGNIVMTEGGGVCKIASTSYNLAVLADLEIVERHHHSMPINYIPYGQDATVSYGIKDFKFKNNTKSNILIWSQMIDNRLYMAFYGSQRPPQVEWNHEITDVLEPSIKYIKNPDLKKGQMNTITEGLMGARVKSSITLKYSDGSIKIKNMGISNYRPLAKIIEAN